MASSKASTAVSSLEEQVIDVVYLVFLDTSYIKI